MANLLIAAVLVAVTSILDISTGTNLRWEHFYLLPIFFATWTAGLGAGLGVCAISSLAGVACSVVAAPVFEPTTVLWRALVAAGAYVLSAIALAETMARLRGESHLARTDFLTGIANRRSFYEVAALEAHRCSRYGHPVTLAYLDCDDFKSVNDVLGHRSGDELLRFVARTMASSLRPTDTVARMGGDEFAVLLPETTGEAAHRVLGRLEAAISEAGRGRGCPVAISTGIASFAGPFPPLETMIEAAEIRMRMARESRLRAPGHTEQAWPARGAPAMSSGPTSDGADWLTSAQDA